MISLLIDEDNDSATSLNSWLGDNGLVPAPVLTLQLQHVIDDRARLTIKARLVPIDMLIYCPSCGHQHIDGADTRRGWTNPPHRSHQCAYCGFVWRHADVPTNGVVSLKTHGRQDGSPTPKRWRP